MGDFQGQPPVPLVPLSTLTLLVGWQKQHPAVNQSTTFCKDFLCAILPNQFTCQITFVCVFIIHCLHLLFYFRSSAYLLVTSYKYILHTCWRTYKSLSEVRFNVPLDTKYVWDALYNRFLGWDVRVHQTYQTSIAAHSVWFLQFFEVSFLGINNIRRCCACGIQVENVAVDVEKRLAPFELWQQQFTQLFESCTRRPVNKLPSQVHNSHTHSTAVMVLDSGLTLKLIYLQ